MHRIALLFSAVCFILVGATAYLGASRVVDFIEHETETQIRTALTASGQDWAAVRPDGLQVTLSGLAPDEASRFRALEIVGEVIDVGRIRNATRVLQSREPVPPRFSLEILRNMDQISLIGLIPSKSDKKTIIARAYHIGEDTVVSDMLETAGIRAPAGWNANLDFGLKQLEKLPLSKISITPEQVSVTAVTESLDQQKEIERTLSASKPKGAKLAIDISAPLPVIAPFRLRMNIMGGVARLFACSADTRITRAKILRAASKAGMKGEGRCDIGLGVPTTDWAPAVVMSIKALQQLKGGTLTFTDSDITLIASQDATQAEFEQVIGVLENNLPDLFSLHAVLPPKVLLLGVNAVAEPPEFTATRSPEGLVQLRGRVQNDQSKQSITAFAHALFGGKSVYNQTRIDEDLPDGWPSRVLAGLEGLAQLDHGALVVQPDFVEITGTGDSPDITAEISRLFSVRLGGKENYRIDVKFDQNLIKVPDLPTGEECEAQISAVLTEQQIVFAPSSTTIEPRSQGVLDAIAEIITDCPDAKFEIGGHTDSQGSEELNKNLSQARAEAVLSALLERRVLISGLVAKGFGEAMPVADNETEEGRAMNRRIAFRLIQTEDVTDGQN